MMKWTQRGVVASIAAMLSTLLSFQADADVVNGGFETGDFTGWVQIGDTSFSGVDASAARSGSFGAFFGPIAPGGISQSFATTSNTTYRVNFSLSLVDSALPNSFSWTWNGLSQSPSLNNAAAFGYTGFSSLVFANGPSSTLTFNFTDPQAFWLLDDVSVAPVAAIPELPVNVLLSAGFVLLAAGLRQRARRRVAI